MTSPTSAVTLNTESRNSRSGMRGSAANRSAIRKSTVATTAPAPSPRTTREPHAYSVPPQLVSSTRQVEAAASSSAPGTSSRARRSGLGSLRTTATTARVTRPNGTLM